MDFLKNSWRACVESKKFFRENEISTRQAFLEVLILLGIILIPVFITAFINYDALLKANEAATVLKPGEDVFKKFFPWNFLFFPLFWMFYITVVGLVRHGATIFLGEDTRSLTWSWVITAYAVRPLIITAGFLHLTNNFFPYVNQADTEIRMIFFNILFVCAWFLEGVVCINAFRLRFNQNFGRALLTWLSHIFLALILGWSVMLVYFVFIK